jgi:hypothetical protein
VFLPGQTLVTCKATDNDDTPSMVSTTLTVTVADGDLAITQGVNPPTAQAMSPAGASVVFGVPKASDGTDPAPAVTCKDASNKVWHSGDTFPVGSTVLTCTAADGDDTPSSVSTNVTITVEGVAGQLQDLLAYVSSSALPPGNSFIGQVTTAIAQYNAVPPNISGTCTTLTSIISHAKAQSGKQITAVSATAIVTMATNIRGALNCP